MAPQLEAERGPQGQVSGRRPPRTPAILAYPLYSVDLVYGNDYVFKEFPTPNLEDLSELNRLDTTEVTKSRQSPAVTIPNFSHQRHVPPPSYGAVWRVGWEV